MRPLSLSNQVLILVTLPLICVIVSLIWLASLQKEVEDDIKTAARARKISDQVNALCADVYEAMAKNSTEKDSFVGPPDGVIEDLAAKFDEHYKTLSELTADNPEEFALVKKSEKSAHEVAKILSELKRSNDRAGLDEREYRSPLWKELRRKAKDIISKEVIALGSNQKRVLEKSPEVQAHLRQQIQTTMLFAGGVNFILTLLAGIFITQGIAFKIKRLNDNTYRLASNLPLNPILQGSDELSALDRVFHQMASELKESSRKERAVVDNARDLIFSIDESGRFVSINPACHALLSMQPDELLGSHLIDLIPPPDANKLLSYLDQIKESGDSSSLEVQLKRKDGSTLEVLLSAHYSREEGSFFCVVHDITERKQAEQLRQEVVAMVTHDLRTPLGTVKNILDFLEGGSFGKLDEKGIRYVTSGQRNVDRMMTLINDLLDVEKISSGRMELEIDEVPLSDCFDTCVELHSGFADELGVKLDALPTDIVVRADEEKLQRVLANLVSNAIKFSPREGKVTVTAENNGEYVLISVADEGPGIPEDQLTSVFDRFHQVSGTAKKAGGSGLGLTICRAITELHGGKIYVESELGKGSKFTVALLRQ